MKLYNNLFIYNKYNIIYMNTDFLKKSNKIKKYFKLLKRISEYAPKYRKRYKTELKYSMKHNGVMKGGATYIPPHKRRTSFINKHIDLFNKYLHQTISQNPNNSLYINSTYQNFIKQEKKHIYDIENRHYYESPDNSDRYISLLEKRSTDIFNFLSVNVDLFLEKVREITSNYYFEEIIVPTSWNSLIEHLNENNNDLLKINEIINFYDKINSLPFLNNDIDFYLKFIKKYLNLLYILLKYKNNKDVNLLQKMSLGINSNFDNTDNKENFVYSSGCKCNIKLPESKYISPIHNLDNKQQLLYITYNDNPYICAKDFLCLSLDKELNIANNRLYNKLFIELFIKNSDGPFVSLMNVNENYFDLNSKRSKITKFRRIPYTRESLYKLKELSNKHNSASVQFKLRDVNVILQAIINNNGELDLYDKYGRKLHKGTLFTTEEDYSDYAFLLIVIFQLNIYKLYYNTKFIGFCVSKFTYEQLQKYYENLIGKQYYLNKQYFTIKNSVPEISNNETIKKLLITYNLNSEETNERQLCIELCNNPIQKTKNLIYVPGINERKQQLNELKELSNHLQNKYKNEYNNLIKNKFTDLELPVISDTEEELTVLYRQLDLLNVPSLIEKLGEKKTNKKNPNLFLLYGPISSGKTTISKQLLPLLTDTDNLIDANIDNFIEKNSNYIQKTRKFKNTLLNNNNTITNNSINNFTRKTSSLYLCKREFGNYKSISKKREQILMHFLNKKYDTILEFTGDNTGIPFWLNYLRILNEYQIFLLFPIISFDISWEYYKKRIRKQKNNKTSAIRTAYIKSNYRKFHHRSHYYFIYYLYFLNNNIIKSQTKAMFLINNMKNKSRYGQKIFIYNIGTNISNLSELINIFNLSFSNTLLNFNSMFTDFKNLNTTNIIQQFKNINNFNLFSLFSKNNIEINNYLIIIINKELLRTNIDLYKEKIELFLKFITNNDNPLDINITDVIFSNDTFLKIFNMCIIIYI